MDKQRILKEAQRITTEFSFWMVSGNIEHLFGYVYETPEGKYELEIKFGEDFPYTPPSLIYHKDIKELLGDISLKTETHWSEKSSLLELLQELKTSALLPSARDF